MLRIALFRVLILAVGHNSLICVMEYVCMYTCTQICTHACMHRYVATGGDTNVISALIYNNLGAF